MVARNTNVLVVPNAAVTTQAGKHYVTVVNPDGTTKQTEVQTGLSDWQNTRSPVASAKPSRSRYPRRLPPPTTTNGTGRRPCLLRRAALAAHADDKAG